MDSVIEKYIKFIRNFLTSYYKILLGNKYDPKLVMPFVDKYIAVRYYDNSSYSRETKFIERINKDLRLVAKDLLEQNEKKAESIKNIFALMGYILYIDEAIEYSSLNVLFKTLFNDQIIKLKYTDDVKETLKELVKNFIDEKKKFNKIFVIKDFELTEKRYRRNLYFVDINQNCNIKLYSDYAIDKAYSSVVVSENKYLLMYHMVAFKALNDVISLDYKRKYVVPFPTTLFNKPKKINRYLKVLESPLLKPRVNLHITYQTYLENQKQIENFISDGYSICVTLDDFYDNNLEVLVLFSFVFIYEKYDYYDMITDSKDSINTTIVTL